MSAHSTTVRHTLLAIAAAALCAALVAGPVAARPVDAPLGVRVVQPPAVHHPAATLVAPPTSAASAYRNGFAANGNVAVAGGTRGGGSSDTPWGAIGVGLLAAAMLASGVLLLRRERREGPHGTPSLGA